MLAITRAPTVTAGVNLKFLAEYCGTSVAMIERDYGRFLEDHAEAQLPLLTEAPIPRKCARPALPR